MPKSLLLQTLRREVAHADVAAIASYQFFCGFRCNSAVYYASPTSGKEYRDRGLTTNFELWVLIFCVPTCFHMRIPKTVSICPHPEKRNHHSFVNISPTLVIDASMGRSLRVLQHGNPKIWIFYQKSLKFDFWRRAEITLALLISVLH